MTTSGWEFDPKVLAESRRLELRTRRQSGAELLGRFRSAFRGSGLVFSDMREYEPGDDVKRIHWKASSRSDRIYVKSYEEERQLTVVPVVDCSNSVAFSERFNRAIDLTALVSALAYQNGDQIGLCLFSGEVLSFLSPSHKRSQFRRVIAELISAKVGTRATDVANALRYLRNQLKRPSIIFIISDFYSPPFEDELRILAARHDTVLVALDDPFDENLPSLGIVEFEDAESAERLVVDTTGGSLSDLNNRRMAALEDIARKSKTDMIRVKDDVIGPLSDLMRRRVSRLR